MADDTESPKPSVAPEKGNSDHTAPEPDVDTADDTATEGTPHTAAKGKPKKKKAFWREVPIMIVTALVFSILLQAFVARLFVIPSGSMESTLHGCPGCTNDRVLADEVSYRFTDPEPGDVVIFRGPEAWGQGEFQSPDDGANPVAQFFNGAISLLRFGTTEEKDFIKRVIATEGQTVQCCDPQNRVLVDGKPLTEPYIHWKAGKPHRQEEFAPVTVPQGRLWVMGDNRNNSADSRFQGGGGVNGTVPVDNVIGKAQFILLPPTRWGGIDEPNPQLPAPTGPQ